MTNYANDPSNEHAQPTGSPAQGEPEFLAIGKLRRTHGIKGDIMMDILTDFPERLRLGRTVYIGEEQHLPMKVARVHKHSGNTILLGLEGIETREQAAELRNQYVFVPTKAIPLLPKGEYYHHQLLGINVLDDQGKRLGILEEILETRANDIYLVRAEDGSEMLLPAVENEVILNIDLKRREMIVRPPEWESS